MKKLEFLKCFDKNFFFDLSRQCIYLQLEKPSGIEIEMPIREKLTIDLLKRRAKRTLGFDGVDRNSNSFIFKQNRS